MDTIKNIMASLSLTITTLRDLQRRVAELEKRVNKLER